MLTANANLLAALSAGAIVGLVVGIVAVAALLAVGAYFLVRGGKPAAKTEQPVRKPKTEPKPLQKPAASEKPVPAPASAPAPVKKAVPAPAPIKKAAPVKVQAPVQEEEIPSEFAVRYLSKDRGVFSSIRYDRSFEAQIIQASKQTKDYYSALKNELLSYQKVKSRRSWRHESFRRGRKLLALLKMRGKTLCVYFALAPKAYDETKYHVEDASETGKYEAVPCLYRIKNDRRLRYAKELIAELMGREGIEAGEKQTVDYTVPYEATEPLLRRRLIKLISMKTVKEISVVEAQQQMEDEVAAVFVGDSEKFSDKSHPSIVNVDTLSEYFDDGEKATLESMKERIPFLSKKATYVKVLARGRLNKELEVEADDFSLDAVKMIVLAGGRVYRTQSRRE